MGGIEVDLFGCINAFGLSDLFGFQNIKQQRVNLDLGPTKNLSLLFRGKALASLHGLAVFITLGQEL